MEQLEISLPVHFFSAGQFIAGNGWVHAPRQIDSSVLILVKSGCFRLLEGSTRIDLSARQAVILRGGIPHQGEITDSDEPPVYYWAHFSSGSGSKSIHIPQHSTVSDYDKLVTLFHQLINESRSGSAPQAPDLILSLMLVHLSDSGTDVTASTALYMRMKEYLRLNCCRGITLQELSDTFRYSPDYLSRIFHRNAGVTISRYLHTLRLEKAKNLLLTTTGSVKEIAMQCGYGSHSFFIRTFVRYEGVTPVRYRNLYGTIHQNTT